MNTGRPFAFPVFHMPHPARVSPWLTRFKRPRVQAGAKQFLAASSACVPLDLAGEAPRPTNAVERGLADVWQRTASTHSRDWCERFHVSTLDLLEGAAAELANIVEARLPNPIEYVELRRRAGRAAWSADLVEHAAGLELPLALAASRPLSVLKGAFADAANLRNDIFSYRRETEAEGEINNGVLVLERFLGCGTQHAVDRVNDMITSRQHQFDTTTLTELPLLFAERKLEPRQCFEIFG